jgi:hypothetical protein
MKKIFYLLCLMPFFSTAQNLVINEIMVKNASSSLDDGNNFSAWVEVYNAGATQENLNTYIFAEQTGSGYNTWKPGSITVPAGGFAVVYFERQDSVFYIDNQTYLGRHASFKLNANGGKLQLQRNGTTVDEINYPPQFRNVSFGHASDGTGDYVYFSEPSKGASNAGKASVTVKSSETDPNFETDHVTAAPAFSIPAGFYDSGISVGLASADADAVIYYTITDGSVPVVPNPYQENNQSTGPWTVVGKGEEPALSSSRYSAPISISDVRVIRAFAQAPGKLPSKVVTSTYLVGARKPDLPVVSLTIEDKYMFSNEYGMYIKGADNQPKRNHDGVLTAAGAKSYEDCSNRGGNWAEAWDRPANFEFFDKYGNLRISQEVDLAMSGQCSRTNDFFKSFKVKAKSKYGSDKLDYDFFASKPGHKYESLMLRFSGTEGPQSNSTMMMDAFMQTMGIGQFNLDFQAYQPAAIFINGEYWGLTNIRERSNESQIYSNYGYSDDDIYLLEGNQIIYPVPGSNNIPYEPYEKKQAYDVMYNYIANQDLSDPAKYAQAAEMFDVDNFIDYIIIYVYGQHCDWPQNNQKIWRLKDGGKWRFFTLDMDFTMSNLCSWTGTRTFACIRDAGCDGGVEMSKRLSNLFKGFLKSPEFKGRFLTRAAYHSKNTLNKERLTAIVDSLADNIAGEVPYFWALRNHGGTWNTNVNNLKNAVNSRSNAIFNEAKTFIGGAATTLAVTSNISAPVEINGVKVQAGNVPYSFDYASGLGLTLKALPVSGYKFVKWTHTPESPSTPLTLISLGDTWAYSPFNKDVCDASWPNPAIDAWPVDQAPLGWAEYGTGKNVGGKGTVKTLIAACASGVNQNCGKCQYNGYYFVKKITIDDIDAYGAFEMRYIIDDAGVFYVNGQKVHSRVIPDNYNVTCRTTGIGYSDEANGYTVGIPKSYFHTGDNYIAISIHNSDSNGSGAAEKDCSSSSDLYFDLELKCVKYDLSTAVTIETAAEYSTTITAGYEAEAQYEADPDATPKAVYINEVYSAGTTENGEPDWIELYNAEAAEVDLSGYVITRIDDGNIAKTYTVAEGVKIPAGGYIVFEENTVANPSGAIPFGISYNQNYKITLTDAYRVEIDAFVIDNPALYTNQGESVEHNPSGTGPLTINTAPSPGTVISSITLAKQISLRVYPNPVGESITVEAECPVKNITISDIAGRTILRENAAGEISKTVATSTLGSGVYLLTVETEYGKTTKKIVK